MAHRAWVFGFVALAAAMGCGKKGSKTSGNDVFTTAKGGGPPAAISGTIEGDAAQLHAGKSYPRFGGLHVVLSSKDTPCDAPMSPDAFVVEFDLPAGPGGKFYQGAGSIGVEAFVHEQRVLKNPRVPAYDTALVVDRVEAKDGGAIDGTLAIATKYLETQIDGSQKTFETRLHGAFHVAICPASEGFAAATESATPTVQEVEKRDGVSGHFDKDAFTAEDAIATVYEDLFTHERYVATLTFYPTKVDCKGRFDVERGKPVLLVQSLGISSGHPTRGVEPAVVAFSRPEPVAHAAKIAPALHDFGPGRASWVKLDAFSEKDGDAIHGVIYARTAKGSDPSGEIAGPFTARVCRT